MAFFRLLSWSFRKMRVRFFESLLIILAIGLGVAVLSTVGTLFLMSRANLSLSSPEANMVTLEAKTDDPSLMYMQNTNAPAVLLGFVDTVDVIFDINFIDELTSAIPEIDEILAYQNLGGRLKGAPIPDEDRFMSMRDDPYMINMMWTLPNTLEYLGGEIAFGSSYLKEDFLNQEMFAVIGSNVSKKLFENENPLGKLIELEYQDTPYTVIGVLKELSIDDSDYYTQLGWLKQQINDQVFVSANIYQRGSDNTFRELYLVPKTIDGSFSAKVKDYLLAHYGDSLSVNSRAESNKSQIKAMMPLLFLIGGLSSLALFIAALNILNLMLARILKRTKNIGVSKAIGASKTNIFWEYLIESLTLGILGGVLGLLLTIVLKPVLKGLLGGSYILSAGTILLSLGSAILMSLLFGIYPAVKASRINPIDALRTE